MQLQTNTRARGSNRPSISEPTHVLFFLRGESSLTAIFSCEETQHSQTESPARTAHIGIRAHEQAIMSKTVSRCVLVATALLGVASASEASPWKPVGMFMSGRRPFETRLFVYLVFWFVRSHDPLRTVSPSIRVRGECVRCCASLISSTRVPLTPDHHMRRAAVHHICNSGTAGVTGMYPSSFSLPDPNGVTYSPP